MACGDHAEVRSKDLPAGASPLGPEGPLFESGERLFAVHYELDDGSRVRDASKRWYDAELADECAFQRDMEGALRCLPQVSGLAGIYFADAACTESLYLFYGTALPSPTLATYTAAVEGCSGTTAFPAGAYRLGEATLAEVAYRVIDGECREEPTVSTARYFPITGTRPLEDFVRADDEIVEVTAELAEIRRRADDGAHEKIGVFDLGFGVPCDPLRLDDFAYHCVPRPRYRLGNYADAACTERLAYPASCADDLGELLVESHAAGCYQWSSVFEVGERFEGTQYSLQSADDCAFSARSVDADSVLVKAEIPVDELAQFEPAVRGGRLQQTNLAYAGERLVPAKGDAGVFDIELETECFFATAEDGVLRCLPRGARESSMFADLDCTRPLVDGRYLCEPPRFGIMGAAIVPVLAPHAPADPVYGRTPEGTCMMSSALVREYYDSLYTVGDALPPDMFVEVRLVTGAPREEPGP
jgi:hypothetical protein